MKPKAPTNSRPWHGLLHPSSVIVFIIFAALTLLVWWKQVEHQRTLLSRHTHDVCAQAAQRLQARVESRMRAANVFARRWSTHGSDFSEQRFTAFATVLHSELPSFHSVRLVQPPQERDWLVPAKVDSDWALLGDQRQRLLLEARASARGVLSAPVVRRQGGASFFGALRLNRGDRQLGFLVVEFRAEHNIRAVFPRPIRREFLISVRDGAAPLFGLPRGTVAGSAEAELTATQRLTLSNRAWTVTISPRQEQVAFSSWSASRWVPLLGLFLTLGVSLLVHLLTRRIALYRAAHRLALAEVAEREQAQAALKCSETRYRSIFNSTTDGLLIIDHDDRIIEANPAAESMHGYAPGELQGRSYNDLIVPGNTRLYDEFKRQLEQYGTVTLDSAHLGRGGRDHRRRGAGDAAGLRQQTLRAGDRHRCQRSAAGRLAPQDALAQGAGGPGGGASQGLARPPR